MVSRVGDEFVAVLAEWSYVGCDLDVGFSLWLFMIEDKTGDCLLDCDVLVIGNFIKDTKLRSSVDRGGILMTMYKKAGKEY
jgi:hypothetical protein